MFHLPSIFFLLSKTQSPSDCVKILCSQIAKPQILTSPQEAQVTGSVSKEDIAEEDSSKIPRTFSDSSQGSHMGMMLPPMDGLSTFPFHKRNASAGSQPARISIATHARSSSVDRR